MILNFIFLGFWCLATHIHSSLKPTCLAIIWMCLVRRIKFLAKFSADRQFGKNV